MDLFHQTEIKAVDGKSLSTYFISDILGKRRKCELRSQQTVDKVVLESALQRHFSLYLDGFLKYSKKMRYTGF
jgi:hypothetical protein